MTRPELSTRARLRLFVGSVLIGFLGLAGFVVLWTAHEQQKICGLIVLIDDRQQEQPPPADPRGREFRDAVHQYRNDINCKEASK